MNTWIHYSHQLMSADIRRLVKQQLEWGTVVRPEIMSVIFYLPKSHIKVRKKTHLELILYASHIKNVLLFFFNLPLSLTTFYISSDFLFVSFPPNKRHFLFVEHMNASVVVQQSTCKVMMWPSVYCLETTFFWVNKKKTDGHTDRASAASLNIWI